MILTLYICYKLLLSFSLQAHFSRLPEDLQARLKNGNVISFEHIYDYISSVDIV